MLGVFLAWMGPQGGEELFARLLDGNQFVEAWATAQELDGPASRARARAELLLRAGDPAGAYAEARSGLQDTPDDLQLLYHEVTSAVWIGDGVLAQEAVNRLLTALERAKLAPEEEAAWTASARRRLEEANALIEHEERLTRAVTRSKALSIAALVACGSALLASARSGRDQGRSSSPVS